VQAASYFENEGRDVETGSPSEVVNCSDLARLNVEVGGGKCCGIEEQDDRKARYVRRSVNA